jgi:hypothetical protein
VCLFSSECSSVRALEDLKRKVSALFARQYLVHVVIDGTKADIAKCYRLGSLHSRKFPHSSGDWKSKIKMWAELVSPKVSLLGLLKAILFFVVLT